MSLWVTGGSSAFGLGQRDGYTLAAGLARLARQDGIALKVTNLGVPGRTLWNEYRAVADRLERNPASAPDLIVSYGGYNDAVGALASAAVGKADPADPNVLDSTDLAGWEERGWVLSDSFDMDAVAALSAARYQRVVSLLDELASRHGVETRYIVQPDALASPEQFEPVAEIYRGVPVAVAHQVAAHLYRVVSELAGVVLDLRHLHDDHPRSVFVDWAHANEEGAALAAEAVYDHLRPTLRDLASRP